MSLTDAEAARQEAVGAVLDTFHESHRTPETGSCWCCCTGGVDNDSQGCDPDWSDVVPPEIVALRAEWWALVEKEQKP